MKSLKKYLFPIVPLILSLSASAQGKWSGEVNLDGGNNFHTSPMSQKTHILGDLSAKVGYSAPKFSFDISGNGSYNHLQTGQGGRTIYTDKESSTTGDISVKQHTDAHTGTAADFRWKPDKSNRLEASYSFGYSTNTPNNFTFTSDDVSSGVVPFTYSIDSSDHHSYTHEAGIFYEHLFKKEGRTLSAKVNGSFAHESKYSEWSTGEGEADKKYIGTEQALTGIREKNHYRVTPFSYNNTCSANVTFREPQFAGAKNLELDFALSWHSRELGDHSRAATLINGLWKDSTSYREDFRFRTVTLTPSLRVFYTAGIYKLDITYSPEYYARKLDSEDKIGDIDKGTVAHLIDMVNSLEPWKGHRFLIEFHRTEDRPDYLLICWFPRFSSQYADERYMGNPELKNSITTEGSFSYRFSHKRFSTSFTSRYVFMPRKITSTYDDIDGVRTYTWVNGGTSNELKNKLSLSWSGQKFKAGLSGQYTLYHGVSLSGSETESGDWNICADAEYAVRTWTFSAAASYQSDIIRTYTSMTSAPVLDAKVAKKFGRHFSVFLQGRNIIDTDVTITTKSSDETQTREEVIRYNRRLFVSGFSYFF